MDDEKQILQKALELACDEGGWDVSYWTDRAAMSLPAGTDVETRSMSQVGRAAQVTARAAMLNCEVAMMQAANQERLSNNLAVAYSDSDFHAVYCKYEDLETDNLTAFLLGKQD